MWGYGIPGAGKTTFASIVIDEVECHAQGLTSTACVAYFYFRYDDYPAPTLEDVLEVLIKQTVEQHSVICRPIFDKVYDRHRGGTQPTEKELLRLMTNIARRIVIAFFFLDALDEAISEIQASLVQKLTSVGPNVKLFVTSRPQTVEAHFSDAFHFEIYAQDRDLDLHIADAVSRSVELQDIFRLADTAWREKIVSTIKGKCGKMFLHASLQLQALQESVSMHDVEQTLESIPTGIEEFYGWTMARIRKQGGKKPSLASSVLLWVLHATRPLTANEMEYVVAMCPKTHKFDKKRVVPLATLTRLCQGLVEIEDTSRNVRLVHYTAQKALENLMAEDRVVYERESHQQLAEICMGHLANFRFQNTALNSKEALEEAVQANTLLPYVLNSWAIHAIKSLPVDPTSAAKRSVEKFVQGCLAYPVILSFSGAFDVLGPLHTAVYFGLPIAFAGNLGNPNLPSRHQGLTPLSLAGLQNSQTTMKELLALPHILVNASGHGGQTALVAVSKAGQYDAATLLLADPRISVNQADENGWTPLIVASALGQVAVATRLLGHPSIEVNRADNFRKTPLIWASQKGEEQIVRLLLDQRKTKISINARDEDGLTALESAMFYNHKPVYNLLLPHPGTEIESSILAQVSSRFRIRHLLGRPAPGSSTTWKQRMGWMDEEYQKAGAFIGKPGDLVILVVGPTGAGKSAVCYPHILTSCLQP
ncbi:hypothetical protein BKA70DRAFT_831946 [Coprinopsis sp. MPI-PUGE-AT-0042]|nr:hypothetical protein BKA70DRAFT_831946 [Coprinopsis sp. MPI-PUGE-AT-0042]